MSAAVLRAEPVSYHREVAPLLRANCVSCHKPGKTKGDLDLTSHAALIKGGKSGDIVRMGKPEHSSLVESVSGDEPEMPKEGEPLTKGEIALLARWIAEGARDDTPPHISRTPAAPPVYHSLPAIPAIAFSPDGTILAVAAFLVDWPDAFA